MANNQLETDTKKRESFFKRIKLRPYEIVFLMIDVAVVVTVFLLSKEKNILSFSCSLIGCFAIFTLVKGLFFAPILNVVFDTLYIILSFTQSYYGEALIYLCMTLPIDIYSCFAWKKGKSEDSAVINFNKIKKREWIFFWLGTLVTIIVFYFVLKALHTSELIVSTISFVTSAMAGYFLIRRCCYYSLAYCSNDIVLIILWSMSFIHGGISYLPMVINFSCSLFMDFYGFINLKREIKLQNNRKLENQP